jgi:hypothetical protein
MPLAVGCGREIQPRFAAGCCLGWARMLGGPDAEEAPVVVYRPISRNDSFTVTSNRRKLLYVAVPVIR